MQRQGGTASQLESRIRERLADSKSPRHVGRNGNQLASERAGIKRYTADDARRAAQEGQRDGTFKMGGVKTQNFSVLNASRTRKNVTRTDPNRYFRASSPPPPDHNNEDMYAAFQAVDLDGSGFIEVDEFIAAFKRLGIKMDIHQLTKLFKQVDKDGSAGIDFAEFKAAYNKIDVVKAFMEQQLKTSGLSSRKAGPREIGRSPKLASERAGIASMTAARAAAEAADPSFLRNKVTASSLKGFSVNGDKYGSGAGPPKRKQGVAASGFFHREKLASETYGIKPMKASDAAAAAAESFTVNKVTRSSLQGFSTTNQGSQSGTTVSVGRKQGPREAGFFRRDKLASERAGIKPLKASDVAADAADGFLKNKATRSSLQGFSITSKESVGGNGMGGGRKQSVRECGFFRRSGEKLASERAGIKPMKAADAAAEAAQSFTDRKVTASSLKGFSIMAQPQAGGSGHAGRKPGVRESGFFAKGHHELASVRAGIKPMTAAEMAADAATSFTENKVTRSSLQGFSTLGDNEGMGGGGGFSGRKMGAREAGFFDKGHHQLASVKAGIKPMTATQAAADAAQSFTQNRVTKASLQGFSCMEVKSVGGNSMSSGGRKEGVREAGFFERGHHELASVRAGIKPMSAADAAAEAAHSFTKMKVTKSSLQGFSIMNKPDVGGTAFAGRKPGVRESGFFKKDKLASERYGIKPMKASDAAAEAAQSFTQRRVTKASLQGFSTTNSSSARFGLARNNNARWRGNSAPPPTTRNGYTTSPRSPYRRGQTPSDSDINYKPQRKLGPREIRSQGRFKLASERAGIKPMTARQAAIEARDMSWATGRPSGIKVNFSALKSTPRKARSPPPGSNKGLRSPKAQNFLARKQQGKAQIAMSKVDEKKLVEVFKKVDTDNSGYIELDEFITAFQNLDLGIDVRQITELFRAVDLDGSGAIDYREFKKAYEQLDVMSAYIEQQMKQAGLSSRKAGPREMRAQKAPKLASERAGIKPATASQMAKEAREDFTKKKTTKSSLKGFGDYNKKRRLRF